MNKRILIIKLASAGDVLRTAALLPALRKKYPESYITWVTKEPAQELLEGNQYIDRILTFNSESILQVRIERFNLVISLDKAVEALSIATLVKADEKYGYGLNEQGKISPFNKEAEYYFILGLDDELKFYKNRKTYQEMIFEIAGFEYKSDQYELRLAQKELDFADRLFRVNGVNKEDIIIGINTGAGKIFANKNLKPQKLVKLIKLLIEKIDVKVVLLGGPLEKETNEYIAKMTRHRVINSGCDNSLKEFSALINKCSVVVTADTLALHIAIALKKPVVALFGPTCHQEIELYNRGQKIVTDMNCAPCYKNECDKLLTCMDKIKLEKIIKAVKDLILVKVIAKV